MKQIRSNKKSSAQKTASSERMTQSRSRAITTRNGRSSGVSKKISATDDIQYVLPLGNGWVIKAAKAATFTAITDSKTEAISIARTMARTKHTKLVVHGKDGAIEIKESYVS